LIACDRLHYFLLRQDAPDGVAANAFGSAILRIDSPLRCREKQRAPEQAQAHTADVFSARFRIV
jgi:hypothetical protein